MAETSERGSRTGTAADHRSRSGFDIRVFPLVQQRPAQTMWLLPVEGRVEIVGVRDRANKLHHISDFASISALEALTSEAYEPPDPDLKAGEFATCNAARVVRVGGSLSGDPCDPPVCTALVWREQAETGARELIDGAHYRVLLCEGADLKAFNYESGRIWTVALYDADGNHGHPCFWVPGLDYEVDPEAELFAKIGERVAMPGETPMFEEDGIRCETPDGVALRHTLEDNTLWVRMPILTEDESLAFFVYYDREPNHLVLAKVESTPGVEAAPSMMAWDYQPVWTIEKCAGSSAISGPDGGVALASGDALPEGVEVEAEGGGVWLDLNKDDDDSQYDRFTPTAARLIAAALVRAADKAEEQASKASSSTTVTPPVGDPSLYYGMKIGDRTIVPYTPSGDPNRCAAPPTEAEDETDFAGFVRESLGKVAGALEFSYAEMTADLAAAMMSSRSAEAVERSTAAEPEEELPLYFAPPALILDSAFEFLYNGRRFRLPDGVTVTAPVGGRIWAGTNGDGRAHVQAGGERVWLVRVEDEPREAEIEKKPGLDIPPGFHAVAIPGSNGGATLHLPGGGRFVRDEPGRYEGMAFPLGVDVQADGLHVQGGEIVPLEPKPAEPEYGPPPEPDVPAWLAESDHPLYGRGT